MLSEVHTNPFWVNTWRARTEKGVQPSSSAPILGVVCRLLIDFVGVVLCEYYSSWRLCLFVCVFCVHKTHRQKTQKQTKTSLITTKYGHNRPSVTEKKRVDPNWCCEKKMGLGVDWFRKDIVGRSVK